MDVNAAETDCPAVLARFFTERGDPGIVSAYLFGSRGACVPHRESDTDVGVLLRRDKYPTERERFEVRIGLTSALISALGMNAVDLIVLNDAPPSFAAIVVTSGRQVFCADPLLDRAFFRDVQLLAADLRPFLSRMRRLKLVALQE